MKILILEDEEIFRNFFQRVFKKKHEVFTAKTIDEALNHLKEQSQKGGFDLMLSDTNLGQDVSYKHFKKFFEIQKDLQIVGMSGLLDNKEHLLREGAKAFYEKPIELNHLMEIPKTHGRKKV